MGDPRHELAARVLQPALALVGVAESVVEGIEGFGDRGQLGGQRHGDGALAPLVGPLGPDALRAALQRHHAGREPAGQHEGRAERDRRGDDEHEVEDGEVVGRQEHGRRRGVGADRHHREGREGDDDDLGGDRPAGDHAQPGGAHDGDHDGRYGGDEDDVGPVARGDRAGGEPDGGRRRDHQRAGDDPATAVHGSNR